MCLDVPFMFFKCFCCFIIFQILPRATLQGTPRLCASKQMRYEPNGVLAFHLCSQKSNVCCFVILIGLLSLLPDSSRDFLPNTLAFVLKLRLESRTFGRVKLFELLTFCPSFVSYCICSVSEEGMRRCFGNRPRILLSEFVARSRSIVCSFWGAGVLGTAWSGPPLQGAMNPFIRIWTRCTIGPRSSESCFFDISQTCSVADLRLCI